MSRSEVARLLRTDPRWVARHLTPSLVRQRLTLYLWDDVCRQLAPEDEPETKSRSIAAPRDDEALFSAEVDQVVEELLR